MAAALGASVAPWAPVGRAPAVLAAALAGGVAAAASAAAVADGARVNG